MAAQSLSKITRHLLCGVLLMPAFVSASNAAPGDVHVVQASKANIRQFPSLEADVLTTLSRGSKVIEVRREGDWIKIRGAATDGPQGYVHGSLLRSAASEEAAVERGTPEQQILELSWEMSKKLEQVLREIGQLEDEIGDLKHRVIRLETKVDKLRRDVRR